MGGGEEQEIDLVHRVMEKEVSDVGGMLTAFEPLIVCVVSNPSKFACESLQTVSALSLSKYMLIRQVYMCGQTITHALKKLFMSTRYF